MRDAIRINVIDAAGTVSFVAPGHAAKVLTAACAADPPSLRDLLERAVRYDAQLGRFLLDGLAVFDEQNSRDNTTSIRSRLEVAAPEQSPPFRVLDDATREASLEPVRTGLVIFNLLAKRIIQVQNAYGALERQDRGRVRENGHPTRKLYRYTLPEDWQLLP